MSVMVLASFGWRVATGAWCVRRDEEIVGLIEDAQNRAAARPVRQIDYARMAREWPQQKAALTRAVKTGDPEKVAKVCKAARDAWNECGAWPDDWSLFQRALDDVLPWSSQVALEDL